MFPPVANTSPHTPTTGFSLQTAPILPHPQGRSDRASVVQLDVVAVKTQFIRSMSEMEASEADPGRRQRQEVSRRWRYTGTGRNALGRKNNVEGFHTYFRSRIGGMHEFARDFILRLSLWSSY
nr:hypothetical protein CFP56_57016 [Quercus suber]